MRRRPTLTSLLLTTGLLLTTACGSDDDAGPATTTEAPSSTAPGSSSTTAADPGRGGGEGAEDVEPCIDGAALADVVGADVDRDADSGLRASAGTQDVAVSYTYEGCSYEADGLDAEVDVHRVTEAQVDGQPFDGRLFDTMVEAARADFEDDGFEALPDVAEDAWRDGTTVVFRRDDLMVFVEVEVEDEESAEDAVAMATALAASADPLPAEELDCEVLGALAPESFGEISETGALGGSTIVDDVVIERTGCTSTHAGGQEVAISVADGSQWDDWLSAKRGSTFSAFLTEVEVAGHAAFDDGERLVVDVDDLPLIVEAEGEDLPSPPAETRLAVAELVLGD